MVLGTAKSLFRYAVKKANSADKELYATNTYTKGPHKIVKYAYHCIVYSLIVKTTTIWTPQSLLTIFQSHSPRPLISINDNM